MLSETTANPLLSGKALSSAVLRLAVAIGLVLLLAGGVGAMLTLLPHAVESTIGRICVGIGIFGIAVAGLAAIGLLLLPVLLVTQEHVETGEALADSEEEDLMEALKASLEAVRMNVRTDPSESDAVKRAMREALETLEASRTREGRTAGRRTQ